MTTQDEFIKRYNQIKESVVEAMEIALERAIGNQVLDFDSMAGDFSDVYPLIGAVLQKETNHCLDGSAYEHTRKAQRRQAAVYRQDYRIWTSYAGDYQTSNQ